jgi:hypothetical protein
VEVEGLKPKLVQDVERLIEGFCKDCRLRGMTAERIKRYRSSLLIFANLLAKGGVSIEAVNVHG